MHIPTPRSLLQSTNGSLKLAHLGLIYWCKPLRLYHIHLFDQLSIQKSCLYIHLPDLIIQMDSYCKHYPNRFEHCHRGEHLIIVNTIILIISLDNQMSFVGLYLLICATLILLKIYLHSIGFTLRVDQRISIYCWSLETSFQTLWFQVINQSRTSVWHPCRWSNSCCSHRVQQDHVSKLEIKVSIWQTWYSIGSP